MLVTKMKSWCKKMKQNVFVLSLFLGKIFECFRVTTERMIWPSLIQGFSFKCCYCVYLDFKVPSFFVTTQFISCKHAVFGCLRSFHMNVCKSRISFRVQMWWERKKEKNSQKIHMRYFLCAGFFPRFQKSRRYLAQKIQWQVEILLTKTFD